MKKLFAPVAAAYASCSLLVASAYAALPPPDSIDGLSENNDIQGAIIDFIEKVLDFILIIAVIFVIVAGIRLIVSGGDEGEKDKAKKTIIYVIVGIIVVLFARVIVTFVNNLVG